MKELQKLMKHNGKRVCLQRFVTGHLLSLFSYLNMTPSCRIWFFDTSNWILLPEVWGILWRLEQCWKPCNDPLLHLQLCEYTRSSAGAAFVGRSAAYKRCYSKSAFLRRRCGWTSVLEVEKCILTILTEMVMPNDTKTRKITRTPITIATQESSWWTETGEKSRIAETDITLTTQPGRKDFS